MKHGLTRIDDTCWEIPAEARADMRVPARVFADAELLDEIGGDLSLEQIQNVATLPGVYGAALAMPDIHQGYGFPVGGVAATVAPDGVISPGGVGYDINCGVRLLALPVTVEELGRRVEPLVSEIARRVPVGTGRSGGLKLDGRALDRVMTHGPRILAAEHGIGTPEDVERTESRGCMEGADPAAVSDRARSRGAGQLGTLGSGNHFLEVQRVGAVLRSEAADAYGLSEGQVTVLIHSGSRGLGHQVCTDYVRRMDSALARHRIKLPDRQLACAPLSSPEGRAYMSAMAAAANFAWANRATLAHRVREAIRKVLGRDIAERTRQVYDVAHNIAKLERYDGEVLCVHRKGATRAFGPSAEDLPDRYRGVGQPVFIPGSMGTRSYVLAGRDASHELSLSSTCHGAGRAMSRAAAKRRVHGGELRQELAARGILVEGASNKELAEEAPEAYKDVDRVVDVVHRAGIATKVARLRPIAVMKG